MITISQRMMNINRNWYHPFFLLAQRIFRIQYAEHSHFDIFCEGAINLENASLQEKKKDALFYKTSTND